jgi:hypothetical protein
MNEIPLLPDRPSRHLLLRCLLLAPLWLAAAVPQCFGEWTKTVQCSGNRVYRDIRKDAGRQEFCELRLQGDLAVMDGPFHSWLGEGAPDSKGEYERGRQIGPWVECDRFDHCRKTFYQAIFAGERQRAEFKPIVPVSFEGGKYVFDFASCRSTWITQENGSDPINLNIVGDGYRCDVAYTPESVLEHGGTGDYFCRVPFSVGIRRFQSLDLISELPKAGLPEFCHPILIDGEPLLIQEGPRVVATTVDVTCASLSQTSDGKPQLVARLNPYAAKLVQEVQGKEGPLNALLCLSAVDGPTIATEAAGSALLTFRLSTNRSQAKKQSDCIHSRLRIAACQ